MKNKLYYAISLFTFLVLMSACKNKQSSSPPPPHGDAQLQNTGAVSVSASGCLEGNEIRAGGTIILENGKPPASYEIHYLSSENAKPIVVAKDMTFNPDGSFKYKGKLPDGVPLNLHETSGNIFIVFGQGRASIYNGNCEGRDGAETIDHSAFNNSEGTSGSVTIVDATCGSIEDKEIKVWGKISTNGKAPVEDYEIHYLKAYGAKPIVIAKRVSFNPDGSFRFKGKLPNGIPKDFGEKGDGIYMTTGNGVSMINFSNCVDILGAVEHAVFDNIKDPPSSKDIGSSGTAQPKSNPNQSPKPATQATETVQFAKGKSDATLTRTIAPEGSIDFTINAKKGQKMDFTIGYDFKDSDIKGFLTEPGFKDISLTTGPKKPNEFKIKTSGNHRLTVNNTTKKKITITLYLAIE